jgi:hypothetical protein
MENIIERTRLVLQTTPFRWAALVESLPVELLAEPPLPGEWSALDCLKHLLDTEHEVFPARVRYFLAGQDFPTFDPDAQGTVPAEIVSPADMVKEFSRLREDSLALLAGLKTEDLPRRARHSELGMVSLEEMLHEWVAHDLMHTVQAERALMPPFIRGSGPWEIYFTDHTARPKA